MLKNQLFPVPVPPCFNYVLPLGEGWPAGETGCPPQHRPAHLCRGVPQRPTEYTGYRVG